ncbi:MAG TPA: RimK/LysX family protein [Candidatus Saccharimonadales bacterium]|jgi:hypothetical protein
MDTQHAKKIIGRAERIQFLDFSDQLVPAKVDTGADISSVWVSDIQEQDGELSFTLFGAGSAYYKGETIRLPHKKFKLTRVANSFGAKESRYVVKLRIRVGGRIVKTTFTLADRSSKIYPVLLGQRLLKNKFLVDVTQGEPLKQAEKARRKKLLIELDQNED